MKNEETGGNYEQAAGLFYDDEKWKLCNDWSCRCITKEMIDLTEGRKTLVRRI